MNIFVTLSLLYFKTLQSVLKVARDFPHLKIRPLPDYLENTCWKFSKKIIRKYSFQPFLAHIDQWSQNFDPFYGKKKIFVVPIWSGKTVFGNFSFSRYLSLFSPDLAYCTLSFFFNLICRSFIQPHIQYNSFYYNGLRVGPP